MRSASLALGFLVAILPVVILQAEPPAKDTPAKIPLSRIWADSMPETQDIQTLEKKSIRDSGKALLDPISVSFVERGERLKWKGLARPGFAVGGSNVDALRNACQVFVDGSKPRAAFTRNEEVTLVFFSEPAGPPAQIRTVEQVGERFVIQYQFEPSIDRHRSLSLALIPVGKLKAGKYRVEMEPIPSHHLNAQEGATLATDIVCKPFSFTMAENAT